MILLIGILIFLEIKIHESLSSEGFDICRIRVKLTGTMHAHCHQRKKSRVPLSRETDIPGKKIFFKS